LNYKINILSKALLFIYALLVAMGCSRKQAQVTPPPEVLVTTVTPQDIPVVREAVTTLKGFVTANINFEVQGYLIASSDSAAVLFGRT
jgi:multidrug efflux pump subunit AcrA (membrane-fusion protein)